LKTIGENLMMGAGRVRTPKLNDNVTARQFPTKSRVYNQVPAEKAFSEASSYVTKTRMDAVAGSPHYARMRRNNAAIP